MSVPLLGEIRITSFDFAPRGWALCDGSLLRIEDYGPLFEVIGTSYGGDGVTTFALPDLRGRVPIHAGQGNGMSCHTVGASGGEETHTLTQAEMSLHRHVAIASSNLANASNPSNAYWAKDSVSIYAPNTGVNNVNMAPQSLGYTGGSLPHDNRSPYLALRFMIAIEGCLPARDQGIDLS